jgi:chromosomal replication initiation ATPase DnaA
VSTRPPEPPPASEEHEPPAPSAPLDAVFARLRTFTERHNPRLSAALDACSLLERTEKHIRLRAPNRFAAQRLESRREALEEICAKFFGHAVRVRVEQPQETTEALAAATSEDDRQARQRALEHPTVGLALEVLEGEIAEIRPLTSGAPSR